MELNRKQIFNPDLPKSLNPGIWFRLLTRTFLFIALIQGICVNAKGQNESSLNILDPGKLYSTYDFSSSDRALVVAAVGTEKFEAINQACHENQWPKGIQNLESRTGQSELMKQYHIVLVTEVGNKSIVEIKPEDNKHMPADMQSVTSFYFVMDSDGIGNGGSVSENSDNEYFDSLFGDEFPQALIIEPGELISGYIFSEDEIQDIKDQIGDDGYDYVNSYCREESWPKGIDNLEKRLALKEEIKRYTAFLVAETGDISILEVTPEENTQMPTLLQPDNTFYFVIKSDGIEVLN